MVRDLFAVRWWAAHGRYDLEPHEVALVARALPPGPSRPGH